jgi:undecaprenyl-diphosphatase
MEQMLQWGLDFIRSVQTIGGPQLTFVMRIITGFGGVPVYLLLPVVYWCVDEKKGLHLYITVLITLWINLSFKFLLDQPRPFFEGYDPSVGIISERLNGLPSGHAQITLVMFFIFASWIKKKWAYVCAALLCFLIGFSRIYLGVHFPTDVAAGWLLGGVILCGYFLLRDKIEALLSRGGFRAGMYTSAAVSFIMIVYLPNQELLMPGGILLGICAGFCLNRRYVGFSSNALLGRTGVKKYLTLAARLVLGIAVAILFLFAIVKIIPQITNLNNEKLFGFACFALLGLWGSVAAPWVFIKLRLAEAELKQ